MKSILLTALVAMLTFALPASARAPNAVLEDGREVAASMVTLPMSLEGKVDVVGCAACKRLSFTLSRNVQFFVGNQEVSLADLKRHLAANPSVSVLVVSPRAQSVVTRIRASDAQ